MFAKFGIVFAIAVAIGIFGLGAGHDTASAAPEKIVTLSPSSGPVGTVVTAELFNAPPNDPITVIFKIPGDPVLTTGTTDANGYAKFTFTIPYVAGGGTWPIFFTDFKCSCQVSVDFTLVTVRATVVPTATPTTPPTATPPATPPPATQTALPTATPTPAVPRLGTGQFGGGTGPNVGILALGFMSVITVLAWFAATRRGPGSPAMAYSRPFEPDDYSTDLDLATLDALRRPHPQQTARPARRDSGVRWAIGSGVAAVIGLVLLRKK